MQEVRKLVDFLVPLVSAEELRLSEEDLKANRLGLEVGIKASFAEVNIRGSMAV